VTKWHPATKFLVAAALLFVPYLLWTRSEEPPPAVAASVTRAVPSEPTPAAEQPPAPFVLPPLEAFTAVVERPLFSPTRRMPNPPPEVDTPVAEAPAAESSGPAEPELRFFGTVTRDGSAAALVTFPSTSEVARLRPGDMVGDWQVLSVERDRLELGLGEERRTFEIFGAGARGVPAPPAESEPKPAPQTPPAVDEVPGVDPQGDAYYGDDAPGQE
jgi:general secretion pathway protein N